jgi:hypothetical protein
MIDLQSSAEPMRYSLLEDWKVAMGRFLPDVM